MSFKSTCHKENSDQSGHTSSAICIPFYFFGMIKLRPKIHIQNVPFENVDCKNRKWKMHKMLLMNNKHIL